MASSYGGAHKLVVLLKLASVTLLSHGWVQWICYQELWNFVGVNYFGDTNTSASLDNHTAAAAQSSHLAFASSRMSPDNQTSIAKLLSAAYNSFNVKLGADNETVAKMFLNVVIESAQPRVTGYKKVSLAYNAMTITLGICHILLWYYGVALGLFCIAILVAAFLDTVGHMFSPPRGE